MYEKLKSIALIGDDDGSWKDAEAVMLCCQKKDARITNATRLDKLWKVGGDGVDKNPEVCFSAVDCRGLERHVCHEGMRGWMRKRVMRPA